MGYTVAGRSLWARLCYFSQSPLTIILNPRRSLSIFDLFHCWNWRRIPEEHWFSQNMKTSTPTTTLVSNPRRSQSAFLWFPDLASLKLELTLISSSPNLRLSPLISLTHLPSNRLVATNSNVWYKTRTHSSWTSSAPVALPSQLSSPTHKPLSFALHALKFCANPLVVKDDWQKVSRHTLPDGWKASLLCDTDLYLCFFKSSGCSFRRKN